MAASRSSAVRRTGYPHERVVAALGAVAIAVALASLPTSVTPVQVPAGGSSGGGLAAQTVAPPAPAPAAPEPGDGSVDPGPDPSAAVAPPPEPTPTAAPPPALPAEPAPPAPPAPLRDDVQQRVDEALGSLGYPWQELGWSIRFEPYRGGLLGLADPATRTITVFVKATSSVQQLRVVLAHEIGHALDHRYEAQRDRYRSVRGIPADLPWYPCRECEDYDSPAGDFAEVFAAWLVGATDFRSRVAPLPDEQQLRALAPLFQPPSGRPQVSPAPAPAPSPSPTPSRKRDVIDFSRR